MARPLRIEYAGALYHVTARGDGQEDIYLNAADREQFYTVLGEVCDRYNWVIHAYCLMDNHYHLLIETPDKNLSKGMRHLNGVYTQRFNHTHGRVGHVFQGRYKAILVEKDAYLLELARYIVLNPVRARMVRAAKEWPWSSYRATVGQRVPQKWLHTDWILSAFAKQKKTAMTRYKTFVSEGKHQPSPWEQLKNQIFLGDEAFVENMLCKMSPEIKLSEIPAAQKRTPPKPLSFYEKKFPDRNTAITHAYRSGGYSMEEVGEYFGLHYSRVSRIIRNVEMAKDKT
ncbi:REP-associated tyrosine transposase [Sulfuriflexus mobilis]|uniref:REP-associated tyrosine transposase n=1 Tax=Sulfuriflexus mobilis TaxID=1811807 RepID=UPI000F833741|nr:transposase [Sulfuriflexus mobilis]